MNRFDVNMRRLALLVLPTFLRRPRLATLTYAVVAPIALIYVRFSEFRKQTNYRLRHNGQVCYLRGVLNSLFDLGRNRITVTDTMESRDLYAPLRESSLREVLAPRRSEGWSEDTPMLLMAKRGAGGMHGFDFYVNIPKDIIGQANITPERINAIINMYKLASKRYKTNYIL